MRIMELYHSLSFKIAFRPNFLCFKMIIHPKYNIYNK